MVESVYRLAQKIKPQVPLGFHLCNGDVDHKHFCVPKDLGLLVDVANGLIEALRSCRPVNWIHMPCPKERLDTACYEPLKRFHGHTQLFLGLVHAYNYEGTLDRISAAQQAHEGSSGVATECGMGRTPVGDIDSIFVISAAVTNPVA